MNQEPARSLIADELEALVSLTKKTTESLSILLEHIPVLSRLSSPPDPQVSKHEQEILAQEWLLRMMELNMRMRENLILIGKTYDCEETE